MGLSWLGYGTNLVHVNNKASLFYQTIALFASVW